MTQVHAPAALVTGTNSELLGSQPSATIYKGSDDLRALFFACDPRGTRGSGQLCCG